MIKAYKATIAIDFDGTITNFSTFPEMGTVRHDMPEFLYKLRIAGYRLVLNTCRTGEYFKEAVDCLKDNGLYDLFDWKYLKDPDHFGKYGKVLASFYVDDSACIENFDCVDLTKLADAIDERIQQKQLRCELH